MSPDRLRLLVFLWSLISITGCSGHKNKTTEARNSDTHASESKTRKIYTDADIMTSSLMDREGNLWFTSSSEGLYQYDGKNFTNFNMESGLCTNQIWDLIEDEDGIIWLATNKGLCRYNGQSFEQIKLPYVDTTGDWFESVYPTVNPNQAVSIFQDSKGLLWVGTSGAGAYQYDGETFRQVMADKGRKYEDSLYHNVIQDIIEDDSGHIWLASMSRGGITCYDGKTFQDYKINDGLSDDMVRCLLQDKEGNIWAGTNGNANGGLDKFDGHSFTNFHKSDGLCSNNVSVICQSSDNKLWLGSDRGALCYYENRQFTSLDQLSGISIRTIIEDKQGNLWIGGRKGNLWKFDGQKLTDFTHLKNA